MDDASQPTARVARTHKVMEQLSHCFPNKTERAIVKLRSLCHAFCGSSCRCCVCSQRAQDSFWVERSEQSKVLRLLDNARTERTEPAKVLLHGIGGIGKTVLAAQVAERSGAAALPNG